MKKRWMSLALLLLLVAGSMMTVHAESSKLDKGWRVTFNGKDMVETFKKSEIADQVYDMQPGDSVTVVVHQQNTSKEETDWYMTNKVIKSLEESRSGINGGAYSYRLEYVSSSGASTLIYDSENVGGERTSSSEVGLHQATVALDGGAKGEDYIYLDRLAAGQKGEVRLTVAMEGESQDNAYQDTQADLQMNFAVERVDNETRTTTTTDSSDDDDGKEVVKTGDDHGMMIWSLVALLSGLVLLLVAVVKRRKEEGGR